MVTRGSPAGICTLASIRSPRMIRALARAVTPTAGMLAGAVGASATAGEAAASRRAAKDMPHGFRSLYHCRNCGKARVPRRDSASEFPNAQLEHFPTNLGHRDGADFGRVQGSRKEPCRSMMTDERRRNRPKGARPYGLQQEAPRTASPCWDGQPARPAQGSSPRSFLPQSR